jgi:predicted TIM-barrel fold metal-dependent hydrolase
MMGEEKESSNLMDKLHRAGFDGAVIFSEAPDGMLGKSGTNKERLERLIKYTKNQKNLFPFYFIDPTQQDALEQLKNAREEGVVGYKIICNHFYPSDERAMEIYHQIAEYDMPLMFHSGILYDGINVSGKYNRPCEFEPLLSVENLRFSIAHLSWPWVDECIAVYGKFNAFLEHHTDGKAAQMYLDITPGTPPTFREGALRHVFGNGFQVENTVFWGSDNSAETYRVEYARNISDRDVEIFDELQLPKEQQEKIFCDNFMKFLKNK